MMDRRRFMRAVGAGLTTAAAGPLFGPGFAHGQSAAAPRQAGPGAAKCVRDRLWLWCHPSGSHNAEWNLPKPSLITPVEAAHYLQIPNAIMVRYGPDPLPLDERYVIPFRSLREVVWSVVGASGRWQSEETTTVLGLPKMLANMTGVMMDDFFKAGATPEEVGQLTPKEVGALRERLVNAGGLRLWVVVYDGQLELPVAQHLTLCDKATFWTWEAKNLAKLEENFARFEQVVPERCAKVLGCYMYDYGTKQPLALEAMQHQCELGLNWLRAGRIEGLIFLASCICDLGLETVEWTRRWIAENGEATL